METELTKQDILELFKEQSSQYQLNLEISRKEFDEKLDKGIEKSRKEFDDEIKKSRKEFDKKLGEITGTWGKFVESMVQPKIVEMFQTRGVAIEMSAQSVKGFKNGQVYYEIDILLVNSDTAVAVEVKSTLTLEDVKEHLERLEKIKEIKPKLFNLSGMTVFGAVAGMVIENNADRYAYRNGLFVLKQKGTIVEIMNDSDFKAREWRVEY